VLLVHVFPEKKVKTMTIKHKKCRYIFLILLPLFSSASPLAADISGVVYGPERRPSTNLNPAGTVKEKSALSLRLPDNQLRIESRIRELEQSGGAYAGDLIESYLDLGNAYSAQGKHEEAISEYDKALQLTRIHNGLTHPGQLPVLETMINTGLELQSWETVDRNVALYWHAASRHFQPGSQERLYALELLGSWHDMAATENLMPNMLSQLKSTTLLYEQEIGLVTETGTENPQALLIMATLLLGKADLLYKRAIMVESLTLTQYKAGSPKIGRQRQCVPSIQPSGKITQVCSNIDSLDVGYYINQTRKRDAEVFGYLNDMKASSLEAFALLMQIDNDSVERLALLSRVHENSREFNEVAARYQTNLAHDIPGRKD